MSRIKMLRHSENSIEYRSDRRLTYKNNLKTFYNQIIFI